MPPLRERRNDIPLIAEYCLKKILAENNRADVTIAPETMDFLISYDWPGNVRELQNWLQFALVKCHGNVIKLEHLPPASRQLIKIPPSLTRQKLTVESVKTALAMAKDNRVEAAKLLGVSRATLYRFMASEGML